MIDLSDVLSDAARRLEVELGASAERIEELGLSLTSQLITAIGEPGYHEAVRAAADIIALEVGLTAVEAGDVADAELRGIIFGFLAGAVKTL